MSLGHSVSYHPSRSKFTTHYVMRSSTGCGKCFRLAAGGCGPSPTHKLKDGLGDLNVC